MAFMDVPPEIREPILEWALLADTTEPPEDAATLTRQLTKVEVQEDADHEYKSARITAGDYQILKTRHYWGGVAQLPVFYSTGKCRDTALPLLLLNRQIYAETKRILDKKMRHTSWKADITYVRKVGLWTTWLSASRLLSKVDTVHAQFRSFTAPDSLDPAFHRKYVWRGGCGGPPTGTWGFHDLLVGFLEGLLGPLSRRRESDGLDDHEDRRGINNRRITVKHLIIDCLSSTEKDITPLSFHDPVHFIRPVDPELLGQKGVAVAFARWIDFSLGVLMRPDHYYLKESKELLERVGDISIQVDGEPYEQFDLSEIIAGLSWERNEQWDSYKLALVDSALQWKEEALEKRRQAGFRVVEQQS